jgi:hypothetical protein
LFRVALCLWSGASVVQAQTQPLAVQLTRVPVQARADAPELVCAPAAMPPRQPVPGDPDPLQPPDASEVQDQVRALPESERLATPPLPTPQANPGRWVAARAGQPLRVAIWGDSHQAAGFFAAELGRQLQLDAEQVQAGLLPASLGRPGVRLPLRKACVSGAWRYEPAHADLRWAAQAGPGMVSMASAEPGATVQWDLRLPDGRAERQQVRLLYQQTLEPVQLSVQVDGGEPQVLTLQGPVGPAVLVLEGDAPLSTLRLQLLQGSWRWHALQWPLPAATLLQLDVLAYPGATVAGWRQAGNDYQSAWWGGLDYDLVVLAFGTNEGNVQPFDAQAYARMLHAAVSAWRAAFAQSACVLIGPGDRGVLVRRSAVSRKPATARKGAKARAPKVDLLRYTRIHAEINRLQQQVAAQHGCRFWSMQQSMGGAGSAYLWQARQPAWMARDLIHFTVPGYQQLARQFAADMDWSAALLETGTPP